MTPKEFVEQIANVHFGGVFNPYSDVCPVHDSKQSPITRRLNLLTYIEASINLGVNTIWMGRDLGYRGGRRTGLPLTDEGHLTDFAKRYPGSSPSKATVTEMVVERTASEIWSKISSIKDAPFLWNVFPFHPHETASPMTNRKYKAGELRQIHHLNQELVGMIGATRVLAIGRDAQHYAGQLGLVVEPIRHPSYGGLTEFRTRMTRIYPEINVNQQLLFDSLVGV